MVGGSNADYPWVAEGEIGIILEKSLARAALTIIGLNEEEGQFRLNIEADEEVARQTDAEIQTPRGFMRLEVGLIGEGTLKL